jgi:very-short-patch-repair endonuclease
MKKLTLNEFVYRSNTIHKNKYDYSKSVYVNSITKTIIICPKHGEFLQIPNRHMRDDGCPECHIDNVYSNTPKFIENANKIHNNKYDYSQVNYTNKRTKVKIVCFRHGIFLQMPCYHLKGQGCQKCQVENNTLTTKEFIRRSKKLHGNRYNYSKVIYKNSHVKVLIRCLIHGSFYQTPTSHLSSAGCPKCNFSHGEGKILNFLENSRIGYLPQKMFNDCRNPKTNKMLKFDFFLPTKNTIIEYDGEQHFQTGYVGKHKITSKEFSDIKYRDRIKTKYAKNKGINLIRIKYVEIGNIKNLLTFN